MLIKGIGDIKFCF